MRTMMGQEHGEKQNRLEPLNLGQYIQVPQLSNMSTLFRYRLVVSSFTAPPCELSKPARSAIPGGY